MTKCNIYMSNFLNLICKSSCYVSTFFTLWREDVCPNKWCVHLASQSTFFSFHAHSPLSSSSLYNWHQSQTPMASSLLNHWANVVPLQIFSSYPLKLWHHFQFPTTLSPSSSSKSKFLIQFLSFLSQIFRKTLSLS